MSKITRSPVCFATVKFLEKLLKPIVEEGLISNPEYQEILANLKHLAQKGELVPDVQPKFLDQKEVAEMLGIGLSQFKQLEKQNAFPFKRRCIGASTSVRYLSTDVVKFMYSIPALEHAEPTPCENCA